MFHQVNIREEDRPAQRLLWRGMNRDTKPIVYEMVVMTFGSTSSPSSAQFVKNLNAEETTNDESLIKAVKENFYVDDYLDSFSVEQEAVEQIKKMVGLLQKGGFELVNWLSNSTTIMQQFGAQMTEKVFNTEPDAVEIERVLGLWWDTKNDLFRFKLKFHRAPQKILDDSSRPTKRQYLKLLMSLYDPLGFLMPFIIKGRIINQGIWRANIGWDDPLPDEIYNQYLHWLQQMEDIRQVEIPRCYSTNIPVASKIELHTFCDASEDAFAAVSYLRIETPNDVDTAFIMAKAKVAPLKVQSIPRSELQAALLASRMSCAIKKQIDIRIDETIFWSDSQPVLCWVRITDSVMMADT